MSAIRVTCEHCGAEYIAGVVGTTPWPPHTCPQSDRVTTSPEITSEMLERDAEILAVCRRIVSAQAEDEALWSPGTIVEAYATQELRTLHRAVEGDLSAVAAVEDA